MMEGRAVGITADHKGRAGEELADISHICRNPGFSVRRKIRNFINGYSGIREISKRKESFGIFFLCLAERRGICP